MENELARNGRVVIVGSINVDYVLSAKCRPSPGETVSDAELTIHPGGKGANQAVAAALSGARVDLIARVGADSMGFSRLAELQEDDVGTEHVSTTPGVATGVAIITLTPDGENSIVVAPGANARLEPGDIEDAAELVGGADVLVAQFEVPIESVVRAAELVSANTTLLLNCAPYRALPPSLMKRADMVVVNEIEAGALLGCKSPEDEEAAHSAAMAIQAMGPRSVVITRGAESVVAVTDGLSLRVPVPSVGAVDTTGAGDAFVGALAARLAIGEQCSEALGFAVAVGTATTEFIGAHPRVPNELLE
jgi:ribokinase